MLMTQLFLASAHVPHLLCKFNANAFEIIGCVVSRTCQYTVTRCDSPSSQCLLCNKNEEKTGHGVSKIFSITVYEIMVAKFH